VIEAAVGRDYGQCVVTQKDRTRVATLPQFTQHRRRQAALRAWSSQAHAQLRWL